MRFCVRDFPRSLYTFPRPSATGHFLSCYDFFRATGLIVACFLLRFQTEPGSFDAGSELCKKGFEKHGMQIHIKPDAAIESAFPNGTGRIEACVSHYKTALLSESGFQRILIKTGSQPYRGHDPRVRVQ